MEKLNKERLVIHLHPKRRLGPDSKRKVRENLRVFKKNQFNNKDTRIKFVFEAIKYKERK